MIEIVLFFSAISFVIGIVLGGSLVHKRLTNELALNPCKLGHEYGQWSRAELKIGNVSVVGQLRRCKRCNKEEAERLKA